MSELRTRRIIFLLLAIVLVGAYILTIKSVTTPSPEIQKTFDYIEKQSDSIMIVSFDHEASSLPEIQPISLALLRHAFKRNVKIIGMSLFAEGTAVGYRLLEKTAGEFGKQYGTDYVFLGFKPQHISAILGIGESIRRVFPEDYLGNSTDRLSLLQGVDNYDRIAAVISFADGDRAVQWIEYAGAKYQQRIIAGLTAAMITTYDPYLGSGQLYSSVGGLKGAAEYENLLGKSGAGNRGMTAQTAAHIFIIILLVVGNVLYFKGRRGQG